MCTNISKALFLFILICVLDGQAYEYHGKYSLGAFVSTEDHPKEPESTSSNDFATASARFYYEADGLRESNLTFITDLRDKHDFFDKLDREKQELSGENSFQARQVLIRKKPLDKGFMWQLGRFFVPQSGSSFTDGAELGWKQSHSLQYAIFGGNNPKQQDQSYLDYNPDAQNYGIYFDYTPKGQYWTRRFQFINAYVEEIAFGHTDRQYFYNNTYYQWAHNSWLSSLIYYDFVPTEKIQNGLLGYGQAFNRRIYTRFYLLVLDNIEYRRRQELLEVLPSSPYEEAKFQVNIRIKSRLKALFEQRYGKRDIDDLERVNTRVKFSWPQFYSKKLEASAELASKKEFTKTGVYAGVGLGYFSRRSEYELTFDYGSEEVTDGTKLNPMTVELNASRQYSNAFFGTIGLQYAKNEQVEIQSLFLRVTHRFGNEPVAPLRDGAPPRGRM